MKPTELFCELSEFYWSAGWLFDLDLALWQWMQNPESPLREEHRKQLQELIDKNIWCWWTGEMDTEEEIPLDEWKQKRLNK